MTTAMRWNSRRPMRPAKLSRMQPLALDEFSFLRDVTKVAPKITLPSPSTMHFYRCSDFADRSAYSSVEAFFADLGRIFREEIAELAKAGCQHIQLDEVAIALLCDLAIRKKVEDAGQKPDHLVDLYIESLNDAVAGAPAGVTFGVHMCRGNFKGHYLGAGGYESVAERFFSRTNESAVDHKAVYEKTLRIITSSHQDSFNLERRGARRWPTGTAEAHLARAA